MQIRSILVHLDPGLASVTRLTLAHGLAERFDAEITVLFGSGVAATPPAFAYSASAALHAAEESEDRNDLARTRLQAVHGERPGSWCEARGDLAQALIAEAAYSDLLILGAPTSANDAGSAPLGLVEAAILRGGTPTLVVPHPHYQQTLGQRVLIAWDGSIPAARAVRAALPFLRQAEQVDVVSWSAAPVLAPFSRLALGEWLKRHDVDSRMHQRGHAARLGDVLRTTAQELASDLIVMGCYGHARLRERVFGGATRSVLTSLPVPVLMAH
jgi:nucleotide-binding universal stress UspA family protein